MFKLSGIEGLDRHQVTSLFEPEFDPLSRKITKPQVSSSIVDFKRFRDVMMSESVNQKFRLMIKKLRKKIRTHRLYGESSFIPMNINTMLTYLCQRSNLTSIRQELNASTSENDVPLQTSVRQANESIESVNSSMVSRSER